jgi:hypothetical protein
MVSTRYSCHILMKLELFRHVFEKKAQISSFNKIHPVVAELFLADGQMDMTKLTVAFRNFANLPERGFHNLSH